MTSNRTVGLSFAIPIYLLAIFALLLSLLFMYRAKTSQIYGRLDDAVNVSSQSVCIPDRYVPGAYHWDREDVVFSTENRTQSEYYLIDPKVATKYAAELAYNRLREMLEYNFPPMVTSYTIEKLSLVNIISGKAYEQEVISNKASSWNTEDKESYLLIKVAVNLELPLFGTATWTKEDKVILREE